VTVTSTQFEGAEPARESRKLQAPTIVEQLVRELRNLILSGELRPGERLVEERLTEQFGISRPPLREALRMLQRDGLVQTFPRRGSVVAELTADDVREIYSLRWALERLAIELGVPVTDAARLRPLEAALDSMAAAAEHGAGSELLEANSQFHLALCALPGHRRLMQCYESLSLQLRQCMALNLSFRKELYGDPAETVRRHSRLLDLIRAGDKPAIFYEMNHHGDRAFMDRLEAQLVDDPASIWPVAER
jgi:DNA-binding GntR family transcriptional regulator